MEFWKNNNSNTPKTNNRYFLKFLCFTFIIYTIFGIRKAYLDDISSSSNNTVYSDNNYFGGNGIKTSLVGDTYLDGIGFFNMMKSLSKIYEEAVLYTNSFVNCEEVDVANWEIAVEEWKNQLNDMRYHENYEELILHYLSIVDFSEHFVLQAKNGKSVIDMPDYYNDFVLLINKERDVLFTSLDKCNIRYEYNLENRNLMYWYYLY